MTIVLISMAVFLLAALGLCVGVLIGRAPLAGSCGGAACPKDGAGRSQCMLCPNRRTNATEDAT